MNKDKKAHLIVQKMKEGEMDYRIDPWLSMDMFVIPWRKFFASLPWYVMGSQAIEFNSKILY